MKKFNIGQPRLIVCVDLGDDDDDDCMIAREFMFKKMTENDEEYRE